MDGINKWKLEQKHRRTTRIENKLNIIDLADKFAGSGVGASRNTGFIQNDIEDPRENLGQFLRDNGANMNDTELRTLYTTYQRMLQDERATAAAAARASRRAAQGEEINTHLPPVLTDIVMDHI